MHILPRRICTFSPPLQTEIMSSLVFLFSLLGFLLLLSISHTHANSVFFDRRHLSQELVNTIDVVALVGEVSNVPTCAQLCARESRCAAVQYTDLEKTCRLLTCPPRNAEAPTTAPIEVWEMEGCPMATCPSDFNLRWGRSRYKFMNDFDKRVTWTVANQTCFDWGGKLAELTSPAEIEAVSELLRPLFTYNFFHIGGIQKAGSMEPGDGWRWYVSKINISVPGSDWLVGEPNNDDGGGLPEDRLVGVQVAAGDKIHFLDSPSIAPHLWIFLCECLVDD